MKNLLIKILLELYREQFVYTRYSSLEKRMFKGDYEVNLYDHDGNLIQTENVILGKVICYKF